MGEVRHLRPADDPDTVLEHCKGQFEHVIVLGISKDRELQPFISTQLSDGDAVIALEAARHLLVTDHWDV